MPKHRHSTKYPNLFEVAMNFEDEMETRFESVLVEIQFHPVVERNCSNNK
jgi:hypothetical protein